MKKTGKKKSKSRNNSIGKDKLINRAIRVNKTTVTFCLLPSFDIKEMMYASFANTEITNTTET